MKNFYARKIFPYDHTEGNKYSRYTGYSCSASKKSNPHIIHTVPIELPDKSTLSILSSPLTRARETSEAITEQQTINKITYLDELEEVPFHMDKLLTEEEFTQLGSNLVRERFIEAFIADALAERREGIRFRIDTLFSKLKSLEGERYLIISHSFLLKIIQIYFTTGDQLFKSPEILRQYFNPKVKTFDYGAGFDFILDGKDVKLHSSQ